MAMAMCACGDLFHDYMFYYTDSISMVLGGAEVPRTFIQKLYNKSILCEFSRHLKLQPLGRGGKSAGTWEPSSQKVLKFVRKKIQI